MSRGMLRDARRDARLRAAGVGTVVVPVLALGVLAALAYSGLGAGARRGELEQVGEEFVDPLKSETPADMALKIQGILKREAVLLKKISERAKLRQRVQVDVTAGQIGKMGPRGPKGYTGARGFQGPRGSTGVCPLLRPGARLCVRGRPSHAVCALTPVRVAAGERGLTGPRGIQGPPGIQVLVRAAARGQAPCTGVPFAQRQRALGPRANGCVILAGRQGDGWRPGQARAKRRRRSEGPAGTARAARARGQARARGPAREERSQRASRSQRPAG